jgi:hypothetical protein
MGNTQYNRWQALAIAQFSVAVALISGLSVAGLGVGLSLLQNKEFLLPACLKHYFAFSLVLLLCAAFLSCSAVVTRTLDFRLTARKVRKVTKPDYDKPHTILCIGPDGYGHATWVLFWSGCLTFTVGVVLLVISVGSTYADRLF